MKELLYEADSPFQGEMMKWYLFVNTHDAAVRCKTMHFSKSPVKILHLPSV